MYASVRECVMDKKHASMKKYWLFYKENYTRSIGIGSLMIPL